MHLSRSIWFAPLLLAGCAFEPPLSTRPSPPVTFGSVAADHVGPFALDKKPSETWGALEAKRPFSRMTRSRHLAFAHFDESSPVSMITYVMDRRLNDSTWEEAKLRCTVVRFHADKTAKDDAALIAELEPAGLAPRRIVGVDDEEYLMAATDVPHWFVRFKKGRIESLVREVDPPLSVVLGLLDEEGLRELGKSQRSSDKVRLVKALDVGRQPELAMAEEWRGKLAAFSDAYFAPKWDYYKKQVAEVDAAMAAAKTPVDKLKAFGGMPRVLRNMLVGKRVIPPARAWHDRHFQALLDDVRRATKGEGRVVGAAVRAVNEGARLQWLLERGKPGGFYIENLDYCLQWCAIRDADPFNELARRFAFEPRPRVRAPTFYPGFARTAFQRLRERIRAADGEPAEGSFAAALDEWLKRMGSQKLRRPKSQINPVQAAGAARRLLQRDMKDVAEACQQLEWNGSFLGSLVGMMHEPLRKELAARLREVAAAATDATDQVLGHAFADALESDGALDATTKRARRLRDAVRGLDAKAKLGDRLVAFDELAGRSWTFGPAAEAVAAKLSIPSGREVAKEAAKLEKRGDKAHAAFLYLRAATVGTRNAPTPVSSWQARRFGRLLRDAKTSGKPTGLSPRSEWLIRARELALEASLAVLPPVATNDPVYSLQDRYLRSQLAGRSRLLTHFGLRLGGMSDVRRGRAAADDVHLTKDEAAIRWQPVQAGTAVDLMPYKVDVTGWSRLRTMRSELDRLQAELKAARSVGSSSPADLRAKDQSIIERANGLTASMQRGEMDPELARQQIDALKRESSALQATINNYNRRTQHINSLVDDYNRRIGPHNKLLRDLLASLSTVYGKLLRPSTELWVRAATKSKKTENERGIQRWVLGCREAPELDGMLPSPSPSALQGQVRNFSDPVAAAASLLGEVRFRQKHVRLWRDVPLEEHLRLLKPAIVAYGEQYGTDALFDRVMQQLPKDRHKQVVGFFSGNRRNALKKRVDGK